MISKQEHKVEVFWLQGRVFFTLIYQTWRLASYYLDYSLTAAVQLSVTVVFTTCQVEGSQAGERRQGTAMSRS